VMRHGHAGVAANRPAVGVAGSGVYPCMGRVL
jgi:hypothetical protein